MFSMILQTYMFRNVIITKRPNTYVHKVASHIIGKIETLVEEDRDARNIIHSTMMPQSPSK